MKYVFYPCDAAGNKNPAMAVSAEGAGVPAAIQIMVNAGAPSYVVNASGQLTEWLRIDLVDRPTPDVYVKPAAPIEGVGWDIWSNGVRETDEPYPTLDAALLEAVDICDEYIDEHSDWS